MNAKQAILALSLLVFSASLAQALSQSPATLPWSSQNQKTPMPTKKDHDGQQIFDANCSRCHNTPDGFPPRISGTVIKHMRVRASLSKQDEEKLLRFLNP